MQPLPPFSSLEDYASLADLALTALRAGDPAVRALFREAHPAFKRPDVPWLVAEDAAEMDQVELADVRLAVARGHAFLDWDALVAYATAVTQDGPVRRFEEAVEAVIGGDLDGLSALLAADPALAQARSTRVCCFDPPVHRATLLHYVAANGVENHRQRTPSNAVAVAHALLAAGAAPDALADLYGGHWSTLSLLASSQPPAEAGLQVSLIEALVAGGAAVDGDRSSLGGSPLRSALVFGCLAAADALVRLGAEIADLPVAAGLGRLDDVQRLLPAASPADRHGALALAAQLGRAEVVACLLDAGEDPDRFNPPGFHPHATPLHHAALGGHESVVHLLVARRARLDQVDRIWNSDPAGWAAHGGHAALATWMRERRG